MSRWRTMILVTAPLWLLVSVEARVTLHNFPYGGLDQFSYVYWPTSADQEPLKLMKRGEREKAFNYCMKMIDKAKDDDTRLFYVVQASTIGYGLKKPHLVAQKMDKYAVRKLGRDIPTAISKLSAVDCLGYMFARAVADDLASDQDNKYLAWSDQNVRHSFENQYWADEAEGKARAFNFTRLEHRYVKAEWAILARELGIGRRLLTPIAKELDEPGPNLALARYWGFGTSGPGNDYDSAQAGTYLKLVRTRWPNYDRGIYWEGVKLSHKGTALTKTEAQKGTDLLNSFLARGTGPAFELKNAKSALGRLKPYL